MGVWDKITEDNTYDMFHSPQIPLTPVPNKSEWFKFNTDILNDYPNMKQLWCGGQYTRSIFNI